MRTERRLLAGLLAAGTLLGAALTAASPTAHAEDQTATDIVKDVRETDLDGTDAVRKRTDKKRDVVWAKASYADNTIKLWIEVRELGSAGEYNMVWQIKDPSSLWIVEYNHEHEAPLVGVFPFGGEPVPCEGLSGERLPGMERVKVVLPASCIGHPDWIKFGAGATHLLDNGRYRVDDVRLDNATTPGFLRISGARIHEG